MSDEKNHFEEDYQKYLKESLNEVNEIHPYSKEGQAEIVTIGKNMARKTNIMISLAILLLIVPVMTLTTYMYYAIGGRADHLIDVVTKTIYVTEPNMSLEKLNVEDDIGFFSMNIKFDVFKRIGKEDYRAGNYSIDFLLNQPSFPKKNMLLDRPLSEIPSKESEFMVHPKARIPFIETDQWDILNKIPDGTVAEVYVSLNELMKPEDLKNSLPKNMELRWLAVDTGMEVTQEDAEGVPITPLGYPAQYDSTTWSPFKTDTESNEEVFLDILSLLEKNESVAEKVARAKSLSLESRLAYIKEHGIKVYGAVITGPTEELRKLQNVKEIRAMKVGGSETMELGVNKKGGNRHLPTISGFLSFLIALISLAGLNVALLIKEKVFPGVFIVQLPILGFFLGVIGLFTQRRSRLYAIWGLSLCIFLLIFTLLMVVSSLSINYKP